MHCKVKRFWDSFLTGFLLLHSSSSYFFLKLGLVPLQSLMSSLISLPNVKLERKFKTGCGFEKGKVITDGREMKKITGGLYFAIEK